MFDKSQTQLDAKSRDALLIKCLAPAPLIASGRRAFALIIWAIYFLFLMSCFVLRHGWSAQHSGSTGCAGLISVSIPCGWNGKHRQGWFIFKGWTCKNLHTDQRQPVETEGDSGHGGFGSSWEDTEVLAEEQVKNWRLSSFNQFYMTQVWL